MRVRAIPDGTYDTAVHSINCERRADWNLVKYWSLKKNKAQGIEGEQNITPEHLKNLLSSEGTECWPEMEEDLAILAEIEDFEFFNIYQPLMDKTTAKYTQYYKTPQAFRKYGTKTILGEGYYCDFSSAYGFCWRDKISKIGIPTMEPKREYTYKGQKRTVEARDYGYRLGDLPIYIEPYSRQRKTAEKTRRSFQYGPHDLIPTEIGQRLSETCIKRIYKICIGMLVADRGGMYSTQKKVTGYEVKDGKCRVVSEYADKKPVGRPISTRTLLHSVIIQEQRQKMEMLDSTVNMVIANTDGFLTEYDMSQDWVEEEYPNLKVKRFDKAWIVDYNCYALSIDGVLHYWGKLASLLFNFPELSELSVNTSHKFGGVCFQPLNLIKFDHKDREVRAIRSIEERKEFWKAKCNEIVERENITTIVDNSVAGSGKTYRLNKLFGKLGVNSIYGYTYNILNQEQIRHDNPGAVITGLIKNLNKHERREQIDKRYWAAIDEGQDCNYQQLYHILLNIKRNGKLVVYMDPNQAINPLSTRGMGLELDWFKVRKNSLVSRRISNQLAEFIRDKYGIEIYGSFDEDFSLEIKSMDEINLTEEDTFICYHNVTGVVKTTGAEQIVGRAYYEDTLFKAKGQTIDNAVIFIDHTKTKEDYVAITRGRHNVRVVFTERAWQAPWANEARRSAWCA